MRRPNKFGRILSPNKFGNNVVPDRALRDSEALSIIGRSANSRGDPGDIAVTAGSGGVLRESGSALGFGPDLVLDELAIDKTSGAGIKVDTATPTFGFRDIIGEVVTRGVGATDPAWTQIASSSFYAYAFALNDQCWMNFHIPHDYVVGTDIYLHAHWLPDGTDTNSVKWQFEYMYADGHNQANFAVAGTTVNAEESPPGTAYRHMVTETAAITVAGMEPDGILHVNITRVTNGGTDNTDTIFMLTSDVHYQSSNLGTKNRAPDFFA